MNPHSSSHPFPWRRDLRRAAVLAVLLAALTGCSRSPQPPQVPAEAGNAELRSRIEVARRRVLDAPQSGLEWGRLGQAFDAAEYPAEARTCYAEAASREPQSARWPHLLGLLELQDTPEAGLSHLAQAVSLAGATNEASRVRLLQALVERGRFAEAAAHAEVLLARDAGHPAARLELARVRLAEGRVPEAATLLPPCLTNPFTARPAVMLLGQARLRSGDTAAAGELASRAAVMPRPFDWPDPYQREIQDLRQDRARLLERVNGLIARRRMEEADALLQPLVAAGGPPDPETLLVLGRLRLQQKRCDEAVAVLRDLLVLQPRSLNGHIQAGLALMCLSRWSDAAASFDQAVFLKPDFSQAHYNLGIARSRLGDADAAIRSFREALRCSPGDARSHAALAEELARAGRSEEAAAHRDRARALEAASRTAGPSGSGK